MHCFDRTSVEAFIEGGAVIVPPNERRTSEGSVELAGSAQAASGGAQRRRESVQTTESGQIRSSSSLASSVTSGFPEMLGSEETALTKASMRVARASIHSAPASLPLDGENLPKNDLQEASCSNENQTRWQSSSTGDSLESGSDFEVSPVHDGEQDGHLDAANGWWMFGSSREAAEWLADARVFLLELFDEPFDSALSTTLSVFLVLAIVIGLMLSCVEHMADDFWHHDTELGVNTVYSLEFALRLWCASCKRSFLVSYASIIDIVCVSMFVFTEIVHVDRVWPWLTHVKQVQFCLRLLRICRFSSMWKLVSSALQDAAPALLLPLGACGILVSIGGSLLLVAERIAAGNADEASLESLLDGFLLCLTCILTNDIGPYYGFDLQAPVSRAIILVLMFCGHMIFAMPIAIVGMCFCRVWFQKDRILLVDALRRHVKRKCGDVNEVSAKLFESYDGTGSGFLEFDEFKALAVAFRGVLDTAAVMPIFSAFDQDQDGAINFQDFQASVFPELVLAEAEADSSGGGTDSNRCSGQPDVRRLSRLSEIPGGSDATPPQLNSALEERLQQLEQRMAVNAGSAMHSPFYGVAAALGFATPSVRSKISTRRPSLTQSVCHSYVSKGGSSPGSSRRGSLAGVSQLPSEAGTSRRPSVVSLQWQSEAAPIRRPPMVPATYHSEEGSFENSVVPRPSRPNPRGSPCSEISNDYDSAYGQFGSGLKSIPICVVQPDATAGTVVNTPGVLPVVHLGSDPLPTRSSSKPQPGPGTLGPSSLFPTTKSVSSSKPEVGSRRSSVSRSAQQVANSFALKPPEGALSPGDSSTWRRPSSSSVNPPAGGDEEEFVGAADTRNAPRRWLSQSGVGRGNDLLQSGKRFGI